MGFHRTPDVVARDMRERAWSKRSLSMLCVVLVSGCGGGAASSPTTGSPQAGDVASGTRAQDTTPRVQLDVSGVQSRAVESWSYDELVPRQQWPEVVGTRRGIVMASGKQPWGAGVLWTRGFDRSDTRTEYRFFAEGSSPYAVYWASPDGRGENVMTWSVLSGSGGLRQVQAAMFEPETPNDWGLGRRAHLVEVDAVAIAGSGSNGGLHFVIDGARVLDGTAGHALVVEDALMQLRARFDAAMRDADAEIERMLAEQRRQVPEGYEMRAPEAPTVAVFPTWLDAERLMVAIFYARYTEAHLGPEERRMSRCPPCPCTPDGRCAPCARCVPREEVHVPQVNASWQMAARYVVSGDGRLVEEAVMGVQRM